MKLFLLGVGFVALGSLGLGVFWYFSQNTETTPSGFSQKSLPLPPREIPRESANSFLPEKKTRVQTGIQSESNNNVSIEKPKTLALDDSVSTLSNPQKIPTVDGKEYFIVGLPQGHTSESPKKIIFSLPGHGSTAEQDFEAWKPQITDKNYALASLNWWHGGGEKITDYYAPDAVLAQIKGFLESYGYTHSDFVVLEGFSRGSANTYSVKAYDMMSDVPVLDAVISASGKYQSDFPLTPEQSTYRQGKLYAGVPWVLACGEKDPNPSRDGCDGMNETKNYLNSQGAQILKVLSDPNGGHGAFHKSSLKLASQALALLDEFLASQK